jgi:hypothetical protein
MLIMIFPVREIIVQDQWLCKVYLPIGKLLNQMMHKNEKYSRLGYFSLRLRKMLAEAWGVVLIEKQLSCRHRALLVEHLSSAIGHEPSYDG